MKNPPTNQAWRRQNRGLEALQSTLGTKLVSKMVSGTFSVFFRLEFQELQSPTRCFTKLCALRFQRQLRSLAWKAKLQKHCKNHGFYSVLCMLVIEQEHRQQAEQRPNQNSGPHREVHRGLTVKATGAQVGPKIEPSWTPKRPKLGRSWPNLA